jgi:hypothetical protein
MREDAFSLPVCNEVLCRYFQTHSKVEPGFVSGLPSLEHLAAAICKKQNESPYPGLVVRRAPIANLPLRIRPVTPRYPASRGFRMARYRKLPEYGAPDRRCVVFVIFRDSGRLCWRFTAIPAYERSNELKVIFNSFYRRVHANHACEFAHRCQKRPTKL